MSTQHPDNVRSPFFTNSHVIGGEDEIKEAFYCYSHLKIKEQLWDFEGKDVDSSVVRKLLTRYEHFFTKHKLGRDFFLTYRVPNPEVTVREGKILTETLDSIPRCFDAARAFYGEDIVPVFEVAVPMVTKAVSVIRVAEYYKQFVVGKQDKSIFKGDVPVSSWLGKFYPESIRIIPLIEDKESMLNAYDITQKFIESQRIKDYQRVWLARSDPALNYGSTTTVLIEKIALQRLHDLSERLSVDIHPILGCGSSPFRGNFKPTNVQAGLKAYPSVQTFTLQSAFKYDYDSSLVRKGVELIESSKAKNPLSVQETDLLPIIERISVAYQAQIKMVAPIVNQFCMHIPKRRQRKLHIGLFGYSRESGGVSLPRAIKFCASLYSLGLPPELLGLHVLTNKDIETILPAYPTFEQDLKDAAQFLNDLNLSLFPAKIRKDVLIASQLVDVERQREHKTVTSIILKDWKQKNPALTENIERAAWIRGFLG